MMKQLTTFHRQSLFHCCWAPGSQDTTLGPENRQQCPVPRGALVLAPVMVPRVISPQREWKSCLAYGCPGSFTKATVLESHLEGPTLERQRSIPYGEVSNKERLGVWASMWRVSLVCSTGQFIQYLFSLYHEKRQPSILQTQFVFAVFHFGKKKGEPCMYGAKFLAGGTSAVKSEPVWCSGRQLPSPTWVSWPSLELTTHNLALRLWICCSLGLEVSFQGIHRLSALTNIRSPSYQSSSHSSFLMHPVPLPSFCFHHWRHYYLKSCGICLPVVPLCSRK